MNHYIFRLSLVILVCLWAAAPALPVSIYIENASFETPEVDPNISYGAWPFIDGWKETDNDTLGSTNTGVFTNTEPNHINPFLGIPDHIFNADGSQLAFLGTQAGNAFEQDLSATYKAGCDYRLTVAVKVSLFAPINPLLELVLYYRDGNEPLDIVSIAIPAMSWSQWLEDFSLYLPAVAPDDPWAGKNIGIAIRAAGEAGGFWDLDNVRLVESYPVSMPIANASFESSVVDPEGFGVLTYATGWTEMDIDTLGSQNTGVFTNTEPNNVNHFGDHDHIFNADGSQMAFLGSEAGNAFEQDLSATYNIGCDYHLTVAVGTSFMFPPSTEEPIDYLELALYYHNGSEPADIVSLLIPAMDPNQWLKDFSLSLLSVSADNPWVGKQIGVAIRAAGASGGFWDIDNVRIAESMPVSVLMKNASFEADPGSATGWKEIDLDTPPNTGVFANTDPNSLDYIVNADGSRLAFLRSLQGIALEQDLAATYNTGCGYRLTVAIGIDTDSPPVNALEIALYYLNDNNERVDIVFPTVVTPMTWSRQLEDVSLYLPTVGTIGDPACPWAGRKIGIAIRATGEGSGFWIIDNIRLAKSTPTADFILTN